ncbi:Histidinol-phosphatase [Caloramator mitchellensis]|uniref:Histidinol-phosphatase n=1 Tax=Caloramator mitchellensis TaxID=908809 RepID=A0A0R3JRN2_CALMK|nr:histidinol phosphate phosphatase [Caloramator mitchellensis]KRQ86104.1 Histidinol-phosphatase [Caloramator mitchellensis]
MFDCHIHTEFSSDSKMKLVSSYERARELNMGLIVTDHMDLKYPDEGKFQFDVDRYFEEYYRLRNDYLLIGIELGLRTDCINENRMLVQKYPFDYVIGSVHVVDGVDIFQEGFYENREKKISYGHYLNFMFDCVKNGEFFDSLGHIDYVTRYSRYDDTELYYDEFSDLIDEILKIVAEREKAVELNTRRLDNKIAAQNMLNILKRFKELGGQVVTIGSDAHDTNSIGRNFEAAKEIVSMSGLRTVYFKERKIQFIK